MEVAYKSLCSTDVSDIEAVGISSDEAEKLHKDVAEIVKRHGPDSPETWSCISKHVLKPNLPFAFHRMMYYGCYKDYGPDPPAWLPELKTAILTNVGQLLERRGKEFLGSRYENPILSFSSFQEFSVMNPEVYWRTILDEMNITFSVPPQCILSECVPAKYPHALSPCCDWLVGAYLNPASNCLNVTCKRKLDDIVVRWRDEVKDDQPISSMTLDEFQAEVWLTTFALDHLGLERGSSIAIDMPMTVKSVIIYLAIILGGYVVVSIADSFAPVEISTRLQISNAKAIFIQDVIKHSDKILPLYKRIIDIQCPMAIVIPAGGFEDVKLRACDVSWHDFLDKVKILRGTKYIAVEQPVEAFTNILFSSGTTGTPKAIPWTCATPLKTAADAWCNMDIHRGDVVAWPTNLGWMMGPWLVYASLLNGASIALYNGSPLHSGFAKFVQDVKVTVLGVIPSLVRTWKTTNCVEGYDWSAIRCFGSTGEASSVDEYLWLMGRAHYKPIIDYCGGTEIGGAFVSGSLLQPQSLAAFSTPAMGCRLFILGNDGLPIPENVAGIGELALDPVIFGSSSTLLNGDHHDVYFKGMPVWNGKVLRRHGDIFERTPRGYYRAHGRADDTMNLGGIKVSSMEIERVCNEVDSSSVAETVAIGVPSPRGGPERLFLGVVMKASGDPTASASIDRLKMRFNSAIRRKLNPLFKVYELVPLSSLPRTASNKVMRRVLREQFTRLDANVLNSKL